MAWMELTESGANSKQDCLHRAAHYNQTGPGGCSGFWDDLLCWPSSPPSTNLSIPCKASQAFVDIVITSRPEIDTALIPGLAFQECYSNGSWAEKTNYEQCRQFLSEIFVEEEARRKVRHAVSVITFALCLASAILLLAALGVFQFFKSLKCDRLKVHKNFMLSLMIRYLVSVVYYEPYIYGTDTPHVWFKDYGQGYLCKLVLALLMYGYVSPVFWMFIEGVYLHSRVATNVLDSPAPFKFFYVIGWALPLVCVVTWATTMAVFYTDKVCMADNGSSCKANQTCWEGYTHESYAYILSVPMTLALAINLLFLVNIVRIVFLKSQSPDSLSSHSDGAHIRKALRATIILFPLLGITNLLFFINPKNGRHDKIYMLFNATMQSSQGIFLAILYCFLNSEVQEAFKRLNQRRTTQNDIFRHSALIKNNRRATTFVVEERELDNLNPSRPTNGEQCEVPKKVTIESTAAAAVTVDQSKGRNPKVEFCVDEA